MITDTAVTATTTSDQIETIEGMSMEENEAKLVEAFEQGLLTNMLGSSRVDRAIEEEARSQYQQLQSGA